MCSDPLRESENPMASELDEISQWFVLTDVSETGPCGTVKPVCNDHLYNKIYHLWFTQ